MNEKCFICNQYKEEKWDLDRSALKNQRKAKNCNHCALDLK